MNSVGTCSPSRFNPNVRPAEDRQPTGLQWAQRRSGRSFLPKVPKRRPSRDPTGTVFRLNARACLVKVVVRLGASNRASNHLILNDKISTPKWKAPKKAPKGISLALGPPFLSPSTGSIAMIFCTEICAARTPANGRGVPTTRSNVPTNKPIGARLFDLSAVSTKPANS